MFSPAVCLLFLGAISFGAGQETACSAKPGFALGSTECCGNIVYTKIHQICCIDATTGKCYCNVTNFASCAASEIPTPKPSTFCPGMSIQTTGRLLNSALLNDTCQGRGVVGLNIAGVQFCNAAYVYLPETKQKVLYTLKYCWNWLQAAAQLNLKSTAMIGGASFIIDSCSISSLSPSNDGTVMRLSLNSLAAYFVEMHLKPCSSTGCVYREAMKEAIALDQCFISSYGINSPDFKDRGTGKLNRISVKIADVTRCKNPLPGSQCFVSTQGGASCLGDGGAPVYCYLSTGESVLYGINSNSVLCNEEDNSFNIIPLSM